MWGCVFPAFENAAVSALARGRVAVVEIMNASREPSKLLKYYFSFRLHATLMWTFDLEGVPTPFKAFICGKRK